MTRFVFSIIFRIAVATFATGGGAAATAACRTTTTAVFPSSLLFFLRLLLGFRGLLGALSLVPLQETFGSMMLLLEKKRTRNLDTISKRWQAKEESVHYILL